jgi:ribose/xylose/arabinose/galactoside ABC-type transport system permease subunit
MLQNTTVAARPLKLIRVGAVRYESLAVLILLALVMSFLSPYFLGLNNLLNIFLATSVIGILGIGSTFVICMAAIDLSVGSVLAMSAVCGALMVKPFGLPWPMVILVTLLVGGLLGLINGVLVTKGRIPPFIVTLGMLGIARGLAFIFARGRAIYDLPDPIVFLGQGRLLGVPVPAAVFLVAAVAAHFILLHTRFGRYTLVIGDNVAAARATGLRVGAHMIKVFALSGAIAGLAGLLQMGRLNAADPSTGLFFELNAITAAIIGGTNLFGGEGSIVGTVIGALIMGVILNGLNLLAVQSFYQQVAIGTVLILAVWLDRLRAGEQEG